MPKLYQSHKKAEESGSPAVPAFYKGMDPEILQMAYDAIGEGCTYPVLYRDETVVRDVCRAFELPEETAVHYVPYGCGEYVIDHAGLVRQAA